MRRNTSRLLVIEDVNKAQIYVNIDAFRWHTLIFTISWFAEHRIIAPVCTGTSSVTKNAWPALHNQCLFLECKSSLQLVLVKRILYFSASTTGSVYIYIYIYEPDRGHQCACRWIQKIPMIPHFKCYYWMKIARPNRVTQPHITQHESAPKEER